MSGVRVSGISTNWSIMMISDDNLPGDMIVEVVGVAEWEVLAHSLFVQFEMEES